MKDGRTHLAHKAEHGVDMATGVVVALSLEEANPRDTTTVKETRAQAGAAVAELIEREERPSRSRNRRSTWVGSKKVVTDNRDHTGPWLQPIQACEVRTYIPGA
jgi:hypothetical protein